MENRIDEGLINPTEKSTSQIPSTDEDLVGLISNGPQAIHTSKCRAIRNLFIGSAAYFLFFSGFWSLSNLQSTMNAQQGIGSDSLAVVYLFSMMSCFIPELMIEKLGSKSTFVIAILLSCPFIASNFHIRWDTMVISAVLFGFASGPLNAALMLYMDEMATRYHAASDESRENVEASFFGLFMFFAQCTQIFGNGVSYYILDKDKYVPPPQNITLHCGVHFYPGDSNDTNSNLTPPSDNQRLILTGTFFSMALLAVLVALLLDPLRNDVKDVKGCYPALQKFIGAAKHLRNSHQLLLIPLSIYCGTESSFYSNEFTQAFIACSWGVHHVGFVTICFGVCGALMAILVGPLVKCVSQMSVIILAALMNVTMCTLLFLWQPSPDAPWAYFVFAGAWGMTDAIWWSQVAALYGLMFPNDREAAFSNFFFWSFLGYFLSYSYANYLTVAVKINIMLVFLIIGITLYVIGQIRIKCASRSGYVVIGDSE